MSLYSCARNSNASNDPYFPITELQHRIFGEQDQALKFRSFIQVTNLNEDIFPNQRLLTKIN